MCQIFRHKALLLRCCLWFSSFAVNPAQILSAQPLSPPWIPKDHPVVGKWASAELTLNLKSNGEALIDQRHLLIAAKGKTLQPIKSIKGYWWVDGVKICLSFMLHPQCLVFRQAGDKAYHSIYFQFKSHVFELKRL